MEKHKVGTRQLFAGNILRQPVFVDDEQIQFRIGNSKLLSSKDLNEDWYKKLPNTDFIMNNTFWVGVYPGMTDEMIDYMAEVIIEAVNI